MKAVAFNGSPSMEKSNTSLILNPFLEGLKEEGVEVELFYIPKLKVNPCLGEFGCWIRTPGKCIQDDDVAMLIPKMREAEILVFACPLYVDGMPGPMKTLIDRLIPLMQPFIELRDGHCRHPPREEHKNSKIVLVSGCGFHELDNFDLLVSHMQAICRNSNWEYTGALLRPHIHTFHYMLKHGYPVVDIVEAAKKTGKELALDGRMNAETLKTVSRPVVSLETFLQTLNQSFKTALDKLQSQERA